MTLRAVIKAGGSKGIDRDAVATLVAEVARLDEIVLVHGASGETDRIAAALGVPQETITSPSGHTSRRTDRRTLEGARTSECFGVPPDVYADWILSEDQGTRGLEVGFEELDVAALAAVFRYTSVGLRLRATATEANPQRSSPRHEGRPFG